MAIINPLILQLFLRRRGRGEGHRIYNCRILNEKRPEGIKGFSKEKLVLSWSYDGLSIEFNIGLIWKKDIVFKLDLAR